MLYEVITSIVGRLPPVAVDLGRTRIVGGQAEQPLIQVIELFVRKIPIRDEAHVLGAGMDVAVHRRNVVNADSYNFV